MLLIQGSQLNGRARKTPPCYILHHKKIQHNNNLKNYENYDIIYIENEKRKNAISAGRSHHLIQRGVELQSHRCCRGIDYRLQEQQKFRIVVKRKQMCGWQPTAFPFFHKYRSHQLSAPRAWTRVKVIRQATYLVRTYWHGSYRHMRRSSFSTYYA